MQKNNACKFASRNGLIELLYQLSGALSARRITGQQDGIAALVSADCQLRCCATRLRCVGFRQWCQNLCDVAGTGVTEFYNVDIERTVAVEAMDQVDQLTDGA